MQMSFPSFLLAFFFLRHHHRVYKQHQTCESVRVCVCAFFVHSSVTRNCEQQIQTECHLFLALFLVLSLSSLPPLLRSLILSI